jgi:hypothetical protein
MQQTNKKTNKNKIIRKNWNIFVNLMRHYGKNNYTLKNYNILLIYLPKIFEKYRRELVRFT